MARPTAGRSAGSDRHGATRVAATLRRRSRLPCLICLNSARKFATKVNKYGAWPWRSGGFPGVAAGPPGAYSVTHPPRQVKRDNLSRLARMPSRCLRRRSRLPCHKSNNSDKNQKKKRKKKGRKPDRMRTTEDQPGRPVIGCHLHRSPSPRRMALLLAGSMGAPEVVSIVELRPAPPMHEG